MQSILMSKRARLAAMASGTHLASKRPEVTITAMKCWAVRSDPSRTAALVVALSTSEGTTGYGESPAGLAPETASAAAQSFGRFIVGKDAFSTEAHLITLSDAPARVRGAVDMALLDLKGKLAEAPVYDVLAGRTRDKARAVAALSGANESELTDAVAVARDTGYRAFSVPVQLPEESPTRGKRFFVETEMMLRRLRDAGADDLVLDCGGRTTAAESAGLAARLEGFHLMWLDEPTDEINDETLKKISHDTVTPVGWGRHFTHNSRFQDLLRLQVIDVLRPDIGLNGISSTRKVAALAEAYYTAIAPFHRGGPIGIAAALHVAASVPNFVAQEVLFSLDETERRMHREIAGGMEPRVVDGFFELPTGPGLGIEVDEAALERYSI